MSSNVEQWIESEDSGMSDHAASARGRSAEAEQSFQPADPALESPHRTVIRPASGWQLVNARELWQYRELLYFLTWRDVKVRYKQTVLGAAWAILQPAMMMVVFSIFFGRMAHVNTGGLPYPLFVFCGLLPWTFFATAIANAGNSVVGSERLITKIYFPRLAIPFASVGAALIDFAVAFSMLLALMLWYRVTPTWNLLFVPPLVFLFTLAALGVGTLLAALNVAYRDFRYVIPFLVQLWMFATPTVYMQPVQEGSGFRVQGSGFRVQGSDQSTDSLSLRERAGVRAVNLPEDSASVGNGAPSGPRGVPRRVGTAHHSLSLRERAGVRADRTDDDRRTTDKNAGQGAVPDQIQHLLNLNPLTGLVAAFRAAVVGGPMPWSMLRWSAAGALVSFVLGCLYFRKVEDSFADII